MKYNKLLNTDLELPIFSLGTMMFGGQTDEAESMKIMDYALSQGVNLFDTANIYNSGASEVIVGKYIKDKRDDIILATKVGYAMGKGLTTVTLKREDILTEFDASLKRLDTDFVDLYYLHAPDYKTDIRESLEAMSELVDTGKVRYIGISNYAAWQVAEMMAICEHEGYHKPVITQNVYNALTRSIELEFIPYLDKHPMGMTVYNPIAAGVLTGKHKLGAPAKGSRMADNPTYRDRYFSDANMILTGHFEELAYQNDMSLLEFAMKWCAANPKVTSILTGVSKLSQLEQNLSTLDGVPLSEDIMKACDDLWRDHTGNPFMYNR